MNRFGKVINGGNEYSGNRLRLLRQKSNGSRQVVRSGKREHTFQNEILHIYIIWNKNLWLW